MVLFLKPTKLFIPLVKPDLLYNSDFKNLDWPI